MLKTSILFAGLLCLTTYAYAETITTIIQTNPHSRSRTIYKPSWQDADANRDGKVTKEEYMANQEKRFATLDKNRDGILDASDFTVFSHSTITTPIRPQTPTLQQETNTSSQINR